MQLAGVTFNINKISFSKELSGRWRPSFEKRVSLKE